MIYLMVSETCTKSMRTLDLHTNELGRRKDVFQGGQLWIFAGDGQKHFSRGKTTVNFLFTNSTLREKYFQISKSKGSKAPMHPVRTTMKRGYYVHVRQTTLVSQ